jgi:hypothetical protein
MHAFLIMVMEVPKHARVCDPSLRVAFVRSVERGELGRIADEENRKVVANEVPIAFFSFKLQGKASDIAGSIRRPFFSGYRRDASQNLSLFADFIE